MANLKMPEEESADFISKKVEYMVQALRGSLDADAKANFSKLSTDAERFAFMWGQSSTHDIIALESEFTSKSAGNARTHREKGNEYFQQKSYLTALREYNVSVLSAPSSCDVSSVDSLCQHSVADTGSEDAGKPLGTSVAGETEQSVDDNVKNKSPENVAKDEAGSNAEQKSADDSVKDDKMSNKNELALAYANRSAALFHLRHYRECLRDIDLAMECGYPDATRYKLFERQGSVYLALGNTSEATISFQKALDNLLTAGLSPRATATWQANIDKQMKNCQKATVKPAADKDSVGMKMIVPVLTGEQNEKYPSASVAVKVQYDVSRGRHTVADMDIKVGDILMSEVPFSAIMLPGEYAGKHCYNCFAETEAPVSCRQCSTVLFCSRECSDKAWQQYHWAECSFAELLKPTMCAKVGHLATRLLMHQGIESVLSYVKSPAAGKTKADECGFSAEGVYDSSSYDSIYHLITSTNLRSFDDLFEFTVLSCVLVKILITSGFLKDIAESAADLELIGGAVLRHLQIIQCNAFRIIELTRPTKFDEPKPEPVGVGLYPTVSLINHSCDPNVDLNFYGDTVVVRAIRNIAESEEIRISYGPLFYEVKRKLRHSQLKGVYFFNCKCDACRENWPIVQEMFDETPRYRCENCRAPLATEDKFERKYFTCCVCKHKQDMEDAVGRLQLSYDVFARAMNTAMSGGTSQALPDFVQHLLLLQRYIQHPWRDLAACQSAVKYCYRFMANVRH